MTLREISDAWEKANIPPIFLKSKKEGQGNYRLVSLMYVPVKVMDQILLEATSKHLKDKKGIGNCQHELNKGKLCLHNLNAFYNETMSPLDEERGG